MNKLSYRRILLLMRLTYRESFLSIGSFDPIDLPSFSIITGVNGSGKTQLLQAISSKKVFVDGSGEKSVVYFNYEDFKLDNESRFNSSGIIDEKQAAWNFFQQTVMPVIKNYEVQLNPHVSDLNTWSLKLNKPMWNLSASEINDVEISGALEEYKKRIREYFRNEKQKNNKNAQGIYVLLRKLPYPIGNIEQGEFFDLYRPFTYKNDFLPSQLGKVIWDYYVQHQQNELREYQNKEKGKKVSFLSESDFKKRFGEDPVVVINDILETFDSLDYRLRSPEGEDVFLPFQLKLIHKDLADLEIGFEALSSGERILMSLVASIYKAASDNHFPEVLLLDEVDASLHPSMIKNLLNVIEEVFISKGTKVILVTHSPTTVALAPEGSLFLMEKSGQKRVLKVSKKEALNILSEGFISLTFQGAEEELDLKIDEADRPIVFTEGPSDKRILKVAWEKLYPEKEMPFVLQSAFDAYFLKNTFARGEIFKNDPTKKFVGILDFDEAVKPWKELRDLGSYEEVAGVEKVLRHKGGNGWVMLLPVPDFRRGYADISYPRSYLSIELLFPDSVIGSYCEDIESAGGVSFKKFKDAKKMKFAEEVKDLEVDDFTEFKQLFELIESCLN